MYPWQSDYWVGFLPFLATFLVLIGLVGLIMTSPKKIWAWILLLGGGMWAFIIWRRHKQYRPLPNYSHYPTAADWERLEG